MWAATMLTGACSVSDVRVLFPLPPTSEHPRMGLSPRQGTGLALGMLQCQPCPWTHTCSLPAHTMGSVPWHHLR